MAIKMRVLYNSAKPKIKNIANEIKAHYDLGVNAVDVIPPAYSCDKVTPKRLNIISDRRNDSQTSYCNSTFHRDILII
mgnify:CR=1 FL=1